MAALSSETQIKFSQDEFERLRNFIYEQTGLFFSSVRKPILEKKVAERIKAAGARGVNVYLKTLMGPMTGAREFQTLLDAITVTETSFFRDTAQIDAFAKKIVPEIVKARMEGGMRRLRIWSAGCATGEEPYTIAMVLSDSEAVSQNNIRVEILACDLNEEALRRARLGVYDKYSLRNAPKQYVEKNFAEGKEEGTFHVADTLKRSIFWKKVNLAKVDWSKPLGKFDVIFCRNVLIYFDDTSKKKVVGGFHENLNNGGYLFLGQSESLRGISTDFKLIHFIRAMGHRKD